MAVTHWDQVTVHIALARHRTKSQVQKIAMCRGSTAAHPSRVIPKKNLDRQLADSVKLEGPALAVKSIEPDSDPAQGLESLVFKSIGFKL